MYEKLFSPFQVRGLQLKNRIVLPAMGTKFSGNGREVTDRLIQYQVARAKGGSGLNLVEVASVHTPSAPRHFLSISEDSYIPGLRRLTDAIHAAGGKAGIQLWQGSLAVGMDKAAMVLVASDMPVSPEITLPGMTKEQIAEVVICYGKAAHITTCRILSFPAASTTARTSTAAALKTAHASRWSVSAKSVPTCRTPCRCLCALTHRTIIWKMA